MKTQLPFARISRLLALVDWIYGLVTILCYVKAWDECTTLDIVGEDEEHGQTNKCLSLIFLWHIPLHLWEPSPPAPSDDSYNQLETDHAAAHEHRNIHRVRSHSGMLEHRTFASRLRFAVPSLFLSRQVPSQTSGGDPRSDLAHIKARGKNLLACFTSKLSRLQLICLFRSNCEPTTKPHPCVGC